MSEPALVPDIERLRRKLAAPPPLLASAYRRFQDRLVADPLFRRHHVFLPALMGDPAAIAEAKTIILEESHDPLLLARGQAPGSATRAQESLDGHIWCIAPRAMRLAVYFSWLEARGAWSEAERAAVARDVLAFFYDYVVPVLRARIPAGHNQQLSMVLCSAVAGHALGGVSAVAARAHALKAYALPKLRQSLGLMPCSGYSGEGSTYQTCVVSGLVMWAGIFLSQLGESEVWSHTWPPNGSTLAGTLRLEASLGSAAGLLPPWDHYGWSSLTNLAARTLWAAVSGEDHLLAAAAGVWDRESFVAWRPDDRLWTLVYWPERESEVLREGRQARNAACRTETPVLTGWSLPAVGAAIEHLPLRMRVILAWDRCSGGLQGICRNHANPNHLMLELAGEPITADGWDDGSQRLFSGDAVAHTVNGLSERERQMVTQQYGSLDKWVRTSQQGFLGSSCAIVVDGLDAYFPREGREGRLLFEKRGSDRHTVVADSTAYYRPAFDVRRMRRAVSMGASGEAWVVDDIEADSTHRFTWRAWMRRAARLHGDCGLRLDMPSGTAVTLAWRVQSDAGVPPGPATLVAAPTFPAHGPGRLWPDEGSTRCDLTVAGRRVRFVVCLVPRAVDGLSIAAVAADVWEAVWAGGVSRFVLPPELGIQPEPSSPPPDEPDVHTFSDLDDEPFALLDEPDGALLAALDNPDRTAWRRTGAAMQTLAVRGNRDALPRILALLEDALQDYTVHSVAAWCLGRTCYQPAMEALRRMAAIPEENAAARANWAIERCRRPAPTHEEVR